jgi:hypothetical protein
MIIVIQKKINHNQPILKSSFKNIVNNNKYKKRKSLI